MPIIYILGMADIFTSDDNSTPLTPEEREGLKPKWITLRRELNEFETRNILDAEMWLATHKQQEVLNDTFLMKLHKRMFGYIPQLGNSRPASPQACFNPPVP